MSRLPIGNLIRLALAAIALSFPAFVRAGEDDGGYRLHDPALRVRLLATIPGESLAQVVADPAGRLFLGGREAVFVVEPEDVEVGFGAQIEDPQMPIGHEPHQVMAGVVSGDHQPGGPVALPERTGECACGIAGPERSGLRVEAKAWRREAVPGPARRWSGLDAP